MSAQMPCIYPSILESNPRGRESCKQVSGCCWDRRLRSEHGWRTGKGTPEMLGGCCLFCLQCGSARWGLWRDTHHRVFLAVLGAGDDDAGLFCRGNRRMLKL